MTYFYTNESRRATKRALDAFVVTPGMDTGEFATTVTDLMTNLMHTLREDGHDAETCVGRALDYFRDDAQEILENAERELNHKRLRGQLAGHLAAFKAAAMMLLQSWEEAENAGLVFEEDGYPSWMPSLDEAVSELLNLCFRFGDSLAEAKPPTRWESTVTVVHYGSEDQASEFVRELGDQLIQEEHIVRVEGHSVGVDEPDVPTPTRLQKHGARMADAVRESVDGES